jgi:hypothetical protein
MFDHHFTIIGGEICLGKTGYCIEECIALGGQATLGIEAWGVWANAGRSPPTNPEHHRFLFASSMSSLSHRLLNLCPLSPLKTRSPKHTRHVDRENRGGVKNHSCTLVPLRLERKLAYYGFRQNVAGSHAVATDNRERYFCQALQASIPFVI